MNGARALLRTLVGAGVDVCFANPGTSEMHFVAALDDVPEMRGVLCLFEGVATGAADGYARMSGGPAATLLHLGPGLANGVANLHNASRARSPIVNVVGDHALDHKPLDAPLESDIVGLARPVSSWVGTPRRVEDVGRSAAAAVAAAQGPPGGVATLILPADVSWGGGARPAAAPAVPDRPPVDGEVIDELAHLLTRGRDCVLLLGGHALGPEALAAADRIVAATGARALAETFPARITRGAGVAAIERLGYGTDQASGQLANARYVILVDAAEPVSFFAYPGHPGRLTPPGCDVRALSRPGDAAADALCQLADRVAPGVAPRLRPLERPSVPDGDLDARTLADAIGALLPEGAIVSDEANTSGVFLPAATAGAPRHDWLTLTGGAIGQGLPLAVGAAIACPGRKVVALEADGSALYTPQALWTMARESLDVTVVALTNRSYAILDLELQRVRAGAAGPRARRLLDLSDPDVDLATVAVGLGVPATRAATAKDFVAAFEGSMASAGPSFIEAVVPSIVPRA